MRIKVSTEGFVRLEAETLQENYKLFAIAPGAEKIEKGGARIARPAKFHRSWGSRDIKECEVCGKGYKNNLGLSVHQYRIHGIRGKIFQAKMARANGLSGEVRVPITIERPNEP